jgi:FkbH-like protein
MRLLELKKNLRKDFSSLKAVRVAVLGDSTTQFLTQAIRGYGYEIGLNLEIFEADYDQIDRQVMESSSELYRYCPEYVFLLSTTPKLLDRFYRTEIFRRSQFAVEQAARFDAILSQLNLNVNDAKIVFTNFIELNDAVFGQYANKTNVSFLNQVRRLNCELMTLAERTKNLFICDVAAFSSELGHAACLDNRNRIEADIAFSLDFLPKVAKALTDIIQAVSGSARKCLILDLDNTLWGGVIGDDGIENIQVGRLGQGKAFTELQYWARELKQRGIILAVCSKNDERIARGPFESHPDMVLTLDDVAVFVASWDSKVENIKKIKSILNIGYDSMVFVDDNPYERGIVKHHLPDICVPDLPDDPADYLSFLRSLNLFETASYTEEDGQRTVQLQLNMERERFQSSFTDERGFLQSLGMTAELRPFDTFNIPRVAQLIQRSNQFNLRTIRYTEESLSKLCEASTYITIALSVHDRFGSHGLISAVIAGIGVDELFIDTWIMSCRVLKRGVENLMLNELVDIAAARGAKRIIGEFIPTKKNALVRDHYGNLGFAVQKNGLWSLDVLDYVPREHFIERLRSPCSDVAM